MLFQAGVHKERTMTKDRVHRLRAGLLGALALAALAGGVWFALDSSRQVGRGGDTRAKTELDVKSEYSHIKVTRTDNVRTLWFVRDNGEEVVESQQDLG